MQKITAEGNESLTIDEQKRHLKGFIWAFRDFYSVRTEGGYTVFEFDDLISQGRIKINKSNQLTNQESNTS